MRKLETVKASINEAMGKRLRQEDDIKEKKLKELETNIKLEIKK